MEKCIKNIVAKFLCIILKKNYIIVDKLFPLQYIIMDNIQITGKGLMYLEYLEEHPNGTSEEFEGIYSKMFK